MGNWYSHYLLDTGRAGVVWMLIAFAATFTITRGITRKIHARARAEGDMSKQDEGAIKDVIIGGVHIHHQVWGILLVLVTGLIEFAYRPSSPWLEIVAALFGIGAALTLDEFALWLYLQDVYWCDVGRKSVDAVVVAGALIAATLLGSNPFGVEQQYQGPGMMWIVPVLIVVNIALVVITLMKGKYLFAIIGTLVPVFSIIGAIVIAKPSSPWARRFYKASPRRQQRAAAHAVRMARITTRLRDIVGGVPDIRPGDN
jgi:hypothetical protein